MKKNPYKKAKLNALRRHIQKLQEYLMRHANKQIILSAECVQMFQENIEDLEDQFIALSIQN
jgi:hypothetical protein